MKLNVTILGLMGVIASIAVGMAALRNSNELWAGLIVILTLSVLCTATLVAIYRRGAWAGFAVFGWAMFLTCQPNSLTTEGPTSPMAHAVFWLFLSVTPCVNSASPVLNGPTGPIYEVSVANVRIGLCLTSIVFGCLGAIIGALIARCCVAERDSDNRAHPA